MRRYWPSCKGASRMRDDPFARRLGAEREKSIGKSTRTERALFSIWTFTCWSAGDTAGAGAGLVSPASCKVDRFASQRGHCLMCAATDLIKTNGSVPRLNATSSSLSGHPRKAVGEEPAVFGNGLASDIARDPYAKPWLRY